MTRNVWIAIAVAVAAVLIGVGIWLWSKKNKESLAKTIADALKAGKKAADGGKPASKSKKADPEFEAKKEIVRQLQASGKRAALTASGKVLVDGEELDVAGAVAKAEAEEKEEAEPVAADA